MNVFSTASLGLAFVCATAAAQGGEPQLTPEQIRKGAAIFAQHCATCHGTRMRNPQWAINLRDFPRNAHARFVDSVTNGKRNMPPWDDVLDPDEIDNVIAGTMARFELAKEQARRRKFQVAVKNAARFAAQIKE